MNRRRILLAVTGLSPQVVTETVYALAKGNRDAPWIPDEIQLITTEEGANRARLSLLSDKPAWFRRLIEDYALPPILFDESCIHIVPDAAGLPLQDIRTPEDNESVADFICERVRELTSDSGTELHVSIAGGRKTMGFYLGYALSLFGRSQDRLSHVLVSDPYESSWEFFYPTPYSHVIKTRNNSLADARDAKVTLAEIPFVSLRHDLSDQLLLGEMGFRDVVVSAKRALEPPSLCIDLANKRISCSGTHIHLPPVQLAMLALFARRSIEEKNPLPAPAKDVPDEKWARRFLSEYERINSNPMDETERTRKALQKGMDGNYFSEKKSALHKTLKKKLGRHAEPFLISDDGKRPRKYRLKLPGSAIRFTSLDEPPQACDPCQGNHTLRK
ncbi:CRISPR-associated ring nuclease Csm6 [Thiolapillus sp.]